jgi:hypothetical protein
VLVYFVQHVFHEREDHYCKLAAEKNAHLEYGNQWLLVIQSIDAIEDPEERVRRQTRLADVTYREALQQAADEIEAGSLRVSWHNKTRIRISNDCQRGLACDERDERRRKRCFSHR